MTAICFAPLLGDILELARNGHEVHISLTKERSDHDENRTGETRRTRGDWLVKRAKLAEPPVTDVGTRNEALKGLRDVSSTSPREAIKSATAGRPIGLVPRNGLCVTQSWRTSRRTLTAVPDWQSQPSHLVSGFLYLIWRAGTQVSRWNPEEQREQ